MSDLDRISAPSAAPEREAPILARRIAAIVVRERASKIRRQGVRKTMRRFEKRPGFLGFARERNVGRIALRAVSDAACWQFRREREHHEM